MCLVLAELMFPDSRFGLAMHVNGVAGLFETSGPDRFKSGALQSLFVGFRPLLMVQAIQSRKATFIASKEWIEIPLSTCNPSLMQQLINLVAKLPFLLEEADRFIRTPCETESAQVSKLWDDYIELLLQLERWEEALNCERPGFWAQSSHSTLRIPSPPGTPLWFTNITMANFWAHMWAFQVICAVELGRLEASFQNWGSQPFKQGRFFCSEDSQRNIQSISRKICLGMEYLVQDDMKLFGPASAILPLETAYKVFNKDNQSSMREMMYIERIVDCLVEKGLQSTPYLVYG
ncbi:hypothetical protein N7499_006848 [Penicillium canescens]|uniref:Uncharacterized protein n=1 Tax=Penicillium canescens TaxID=5083 RepID=A0AAD6IEA2_PENCN|nr:uncharacterized protein N7446_002539 [Penicillium canescens]KAJ6044344.1 hypothetical protein N7460_005699 [Penicillium canescens]KAJ6055812.1 hypothetical protein N7444_004910 [Penicillium canescens]KAJ6074762.1 hypothetical protein N7446_002539 [Penicillium canescens]KAJ6081974.1 hypothetical protein N7499_006848 [Penicillium canescens]KAJ6176230.1 hypothetical protein N7485_003144 [Penicillium canescens]